MPQATGQIVRQKATAQRIGTEKTTWKTVFPVEVSTYEQSLLFTKKLVAVAISNITYIRCLFPENAYSERNVDGLNLKVLREHGTCLPVNKMITLMRGAFDALEKKYLRELVFALYLDDSNPDEIIESYTFSFKYEEDNVEMECNTSHKNKESYTLDIYNATIGLIRSASVLVQTFKPLPEGVYMTVKLHYYDDVTPADYEPPGFSPAEEYSFSFKGKPFSVSAGNVSALSHSLSLQIKTEDSLANTERMDESSDDTCEIEASTGKDNKEVSFNEPTAAINPLGSPAKPSHSNSDKSEKLGKVICPCGINTVGKLMLTCEICDTRQHAECFLVTSNISLPSGHICDKCSTSSIPCTDPILTKLTPEAKNVTCLMRRLIKVCLNMTRIQPSYLARELGTDIEAAQRLLKLIESEGFIKHPYKSKGSIRYLEKHQLESKGKGYLTGSVIAVPQLIQQAQDLLIINSDLPKKKRSSRKLLDSQTDEYELCPSSEELSIKRRKVSKGNQNILI